MSKADEELTTLYLPSNTKCDYFENKTSHFKIDFTETIPLRPGAKVALSEVIYPNSVLNVYAPINKIHCVKILKQPGEDNLHARKFIKHIPEKYYDNAQQILDAINSSLQESGMGSALSLDETTGKCYIHANPGETLNLHKTLSNLLGFFDRTRFKAGRNQEGRQSYISQVVPEVSLLTYSLFIYSDIVYPTKVGSSEVPVLGILKCDTEKTASQYKHETLPILNFVPVIGSTLSSIEIKITDTTGEPIRFQFGKVIIKLILSQPHRNNEK